MQWPQHVVELAAIFEADLFQMESLWYRELLHFWFRISGGLIIR